jgi:hypothetical protein
MAAVAKRLPSDEGLPGAKRLCAPSPLREVLSGVGFSPIARPAGFADSVQKLQETFPGLHVGIITSILDSCQFKMGETIAALRKIANCGPSPVSGAACDDQMGEDHSSESPAPSRSLKRTFEEAVGASPGPQTSEQVVSVADKIFTDLHGMPSVDTAKLACRDALLAFAQEVRRNARAEALAEAQVVQAEAEARAEKMSNTNKVLFRAIRTMNDRVRVVQQKGDETEQLCRELEEARTESRRLTEANKVLQWHLQQSGPQPSGMGFGGGGGDAIF